MHGPVFATDPGSNTARSERRAHWGGELAAWQVILQVDAATTVVDGLAAAALLPMSYNFLFADQEGHIGYRQGGRQPVARRDLTAGCHCRARARPNGKDSWHPPPCRTWSTRQGVRWAIGTISRCRVGSTATRSPGLGGSGERILSLLAGSTPLSPEMVKDIADHIGRHDYRADASPPFLLDALAVPGVSSDLRLPQARQILADWDYRGDEGAVGESIFSVWRTQVFSDTLGDELGTFLVPLQDLANPVGDSLLFRALQGPVASWPRWRGRRCGSGYNRPTGRQRRRYRSR